VHKFVDDFKKKNLPLHMLFNNAGEWIREDDTYTEDGFQVRHLVPPFTQSPLLYFVVIMGVHVISADHGGGAAFLPLSPDHATG